MKRVAEILSLSILAWLWAQSLAAEPVCDDWVARVVSVQGQVEIRQAGAEGWHPARLEERLCPGDLIRVMEWSRAAIMLPNDAVIRLDQQTTVSLTPPAAADAYLLELVRGVVHFFSRVPRSLRFLTPFVNGTVEGTEVVLAADDRESRVSVLEGQLRIENPQGSLVLASGASGRAADGRAPEPDPGLPPLDRIHWALYYPPVLGLDPGAFSDIPDSGLRSRMEEAAAAFATGDSAAAFDRLSEADDTIGEPRFFALRASLLLYVGRVDEARADIRKLRKLDPGSADADALEAVIAAVQNRKEEAIRLADAAVDRHPRTPAALIAQSFARQAAFDLAGALESAQAAAAQSPENGLAWARTAELQLSLGEVEAAGTSADRAAALLPMLSRVQWVKGFSLLTRLRTGEALKVFSKAVEQDSADPLARLGSGLARIRLGALEEGRRDIEIAAALNPADSLLRSYLGKAYYDEKRDGHAARQYELAKSLDPEDPTPYFYDAIRKQSENRPVEALEDIQQAIGRNDNRLIYRSRLLLDSDLAARSASLGRIYTDLGFRQLALAEGWKSLAADPGDFSAHRFLADTYSALPRHQIARVSELLQSQLLQPLNVTPLQPELAESDLFILEGAGPTDLTFNEYNPLFQRNRFTLQASGVAGGEDTWGDELVHSGLWNRFSYSLGQFHYETDGFRENGDQRQDIYNAFAQVSPTHKTSLQAEYRHKEVEKGDLFVLFDPEDYLPDYREDENTDSVRLGLRHSFGPGSDVIASAIYSDSDLNYDIDPFTTLSVDEEGYQVESQYLYRLESLNLAAGGGYYDAERDDKADFGPFGSSKTRSDIDHFNGYLYMSLGLTDRIMVTLGASVDDFDGGFLDLDENQFNPKFGVIWTPFSSTTIRGAAFRTFKRSLLANQTLEPTQVAGFNQFFDDGEGTDAWRYGIGIDQRITDRLYTGAEISWRDLEVPAAFLSPTGPDVEEFDWEEDLFRAYVYWAPRTWLALSPEYQFERLKRPDAFTGAERFTRLDTHRIGLGISFFHPSGLTARIQPTYVDQDGDFVLAGPFGGTERESDRFWVVDASLSYRLPKRWGIVSIEVKNLFDESFRFQDTDPSNPSIVPESWVLARFTLDF